jgi:hypothetical protein
MGKKARDIAALAGLAGLAYANRDKLFGSKSKDDAGDQKTSSYTGDTKKVSASDDRMSNEDYIKSRMKKAPEDEKGSAQSDVLKAVTAPKSASNDKAPSQGVLPQKSLTPEVKPKSKVGMTNAQNDALATAGKKSKAASENTALAKVNRGMDREVTEAAKANAAPAPTTATQSPAASTAPANKFEHEMPIARFFKNVREAGNRGNPDAKMASGGMTASRRGDGIASRGKTRGKIC